MNQSKKLSKMNTKYESSFAKNQEDLEAASIFFRASSYYKAATIRTINSDQIDGQNTIKNK